MADSYRLERFVEAQDAVYDTVLVELQRGWKRTHWMWFIFPQITGLGSSATAVRYSIASLAEAQAYLAHPVLGPRLRHCTALVSGHPELSLKHIFGYPDDLKFRSSMTLFAAAAPGEDIFLEALRRHCDGERDPRTLAILGGQN